MTSRDFIKLDLISKTRFSQKSQEFDKIVAGFPHMRSDAEPEVNTVGIYVENHHSKNREFFIWKQFDHRKLCEMRTLPALREDPLISEMCLLEESASHHQ